jgi:hypothetical protein
MNMARTRTATLLPTKREEPMPTPTKAQLARACIADSERTENSLGTRVDAAVRAIACLDQASPKGQVLQRYLQLKYERPLIELELQEFHAYALALAKRLLAMAELSPAEVPGALVRPDSAAELLDALCNGVPPGQIAIFEATCSLRDAATVLSADDPLQAASKLMTKKLNEWSPNESI